MNIKENEEIYRKLKNYAVKYINDAKDRGFEQNTSKAVGMAIGLFIVEMHDDLELNEQESSKVILEFTDYLNSTHGNSIRIAYEKQLGKLADIDYEILKRCNNISKSLKEGMQKSEKDFEYYPK